jgi:hypothetical protein
VSGLFLSKPVKDLFSSSFNQSLFLEGAQSLGADLHGDFFAVDHNSLGLKVRLPDFLGVALGKADVVAVLLSLAGEFADVHSLLSLKFIK